MTVRAVFLRFVTVLLASGIQQSVWSPAQQTTLVQSRGLDSTAAELPTIIPIFLQDSNFTSTLVLVNGISRSTFADIVIRSLDGQDVVKKRIDFPSHAQIQIEVSDLLRLAKRPVSVGSIAILQNATLRSSSVLGALEINYHGSSDPNYLVEEVVMPKINGSTILRGVTDRADGPPVIALSSLLDAPQRIAIQCLGKNGSAGSRSLELPPSATIITQGCGKESAATSDLIDGLLLPSEGASHDPMGVEISSDMLPGSFAAFALAPHTKEGRVYYSTIDFSDPKLARSSTTVFAGIPVGATSLLPDGNYIPEVSIANFSKRAANVRVEYASTVANVASKAMVRSLAIPPSSTVSASLDGLQGDPNLTNSFVVKADSNPGEIVPKLVSVSSSLAGEVELMGKDELDRENGGNHPWSLEGSEESTLLLFNHDAKEQIFNVAISGGGTTWSKAYTLQPNQTSAIDIRDLIQEQIRDDDGTKLPKSLDRGEVNWFTLDAATGKGRLLQSDRSVGMARSFSCGTYDNLCSASYGVGTDTFMPGSTVGFGSISTDFCQTSSPDICTGEPASRGTARYNWSSSDSTIAAISGSNTNRSTSLFGAGLGTAPIQWSASASSGFCQHGGAHPANVMRVAQQNVTQIPLANDYPTYLTGIGIVVAMQVQPTSTNWDGQQVGESLTTTSNTCPASFGNQCVGSSSFTIGAGGDSVGGVGFLPQHDVFYDQHTTTSSASKLDAAGINSCQIVCSQTYTYNGRTVGTFTITRAFSKGTISGTPVTFVTVTKQ